jgi:hypothetical protein
MLYLTPDPVIKSQQRGWLEPELSGTGRADIAESGRCASSAPVTGQVAGRALQRVASEYPFPWNMNLH